MLQNQPQRGVPQIDSPFNVSPEAETKPVLDYAKMADLQKQIDAQMQLVVDEWKKTTPDDNVIKNANASISQLQAQYSVLSQGKQYNSPIDDQYARAMNAAKNASEAKGNEIKSAIQADDIRSAILEDAKKTIGAWSATNKKPIDDFNTAYTYAQEFENLKNGEKTPASFALLVKSVNKLIEPTAAVMSDDMKTMVQYGGGTDATVFDKMLQMVSQAMSGIASIMQGVKQAIPEIKTGTKTVMGVEVPTMEIGPSKGNIQPKKIIENVKGASQSEIDQKYVSQWDNIVAVGDKCVEVLNANVNILKESLKALIKKTPKIAEFTRSASLAATGGETVESLLSKDPGKSAWEASVDSQINGVFANLKTTGGTGRVGGSSGTSQYAKPAATDVNYTESGAPAAAPAAAAAPISDVNAQGVVQLTDFNPNQTTADFPSQKSGTSSNLTPAQRKAIRDKEAAKKNAKVKADADAAAKAKKSTNIPAKKIEMPAFLQPAVKK
jgi:hypothetical protein